MHEKRDDRETEIERQTERDRERQRGNKLQGKKEKDYEFGGLMSILERYFRLPWGIQRKLP